MKKLIFTALIAIYCLSATACTDSTTVKHCKGITIKGHSCKSNFVLKGSNYCNAHNPTAIKCAGKNSKDKPCGNKVAVKGEFCRFHKEKN